MDNLCKLGFLGVEILKGSADLSAYGEDEIAMVFQNSFASLDTDVKHQNKINTEGINPSPAIFVYTLPNILMGEIAIRNKWYGENLFVVREKFDFEQWKSSVESLFRLKKAKAVIGGWIDLYQDNYQLQLYFVERK